MEKDHFTLTYRSLRPGEFIAFGTYPQSAGGEDLAIKWRVLQNSGSGLSPDLKWRDCMDITWHDCDLRKWLNDEFYNAAFNAAEKQFIKTTHCTDNGEGCPDTENRVFLLSVAELKDLSAIHGKALRRAAGTGFAKAKKPDGCSLYVYDKPDKDNYTIRDGEEAGCSWWWLRTQGNKPSRAFFVGTGCSIRSYGNNSIDGYGVRPALIINLP
ncbi:DUF6273 domain-containing protein [Paenibacillus sp. S150]|uniref:DUF6273 domain-containing protein n=1 Tax=Paenibacillus sp. S150 TaxID=2749826 RepID=UPI001C570A6E|nr:DUF6273 domain-containing protein [Paenibacillus sp. S150]MBW4079915.1 hypothetical protein [Paenibacillus sp. S150]